MIEIREQVYGPDRLDLCTCGRAGRETALETNPYGHVVGCASIAAVMDQPSALTQAVDQAST